MAFSFINFVLLLAPQLPSLDILKAAIPSASAPEPKIIDTALNPTEQPDEGRLVLFRERNGWCPYSERVWLALESKFIPYDTFLIDNIGARPAWYGGTTPQVRWEDGKQQSESMNIVYDIEEKYASTGMSLYGSKHHEGNQQEVQSLVNSFKSIFPRNTRPSSRAAFLFSSSGQPVFRSEFEATLQKTDALLAKHNDGPFFAGKSFTAADIAWAPFLERYAAQLPALHSGLIVRDSEKYPRLSEWFEAMHSLSFYATRVAGDPESWGKVLKMQGYGNAGIVPDTVRQPSSQLRDGSRSSGSSEGENRIYGAYATGKPYLAPTPPAEAAARILRNIDAIERDITKRVVMPEGCEVDSSLRGLVAALLLLSPTVDSTVNSSSSSDGEMGTPSSRDGINSFDGVSFDELIQHPGVRRLAVYLADRICVPRDMGLLTAKAVYRLAKLCKD